MRGMSANLTGIILFAVSDNLSKPLLGALKPVTDAIGKAPVVGGAVQAATGAV